MIRHTIQLTERELRGHAKGKGRKEMRENCRSVLSSASVTPSKFERTNPQFPPSLPHLLFPNPDFCGVKSFRQGSHNGNCTHHYGGRDRKVLDGNPQV